MRFHKTRIDDKREQQKRVRLLSNLVFYDRRRAIRFVAGGTSASGFKFPPASLSCRTAPAPPATSARFARRFAREWRRPYIYSLEEVRLLLDIARTYPSLRAPLHSLTLFAMLAVGYCAGLRISEIARLSLRDVDLEVGTITIRETKSFKSRILPLAGSVIAAPPVVDLG